MRPAGKEVDVAPSPINSGTNDRSEAGEAVIESPQRVLFEEILEGDFSKLVLDSVISITRLIGVLFLLPSPHFSKLQDQFTKFQRRSIGWKIY